MKQHLFSLSILFLSLISIELVAQDQILKVSVDAEAEFDVAINPLDTNNIVVATMRGFSDVSNSFLTVYFTKDFGSTWEVSDFRGRHNGEPGSGDPVLSFDADGNAYLVSLIIGEDFRILTSVSISRDGGKNWDLFTTYDVETDKPWLEIDRSPTSPFKGNIYIPVVEEELVLLTFGEGGALKNRSVIQDGEQLPSVVIANDGDIYTSNISLKDPMDIYVQHFTNEGKDLVSQRSVAQFPDYTFEAFDVSTRFQPAPYLAIDNSDGPFSGRIYLTYTASEPSGEAFFNVFLTYSDDQGLNWTSPKVVHEDNRANVQQFYSSIYVNEEGTLILDWYDRGEYEPNESDTDFFMGISKDGGETIKEVKVNSASMDFDIVKNAGFGFGVGEYHQCVATPNTAISFWSDGRSDDGDLNIYFSKVGVNGPILSVNELGLIQETLSIGALYPQPGLGPFHLDIECNEALDLSYTIYDLEGRVVIKELEHNYGIGKHTLTIEQDLDKGLYFLRIQKGAKALRTLKFLVGR